jgi:hypothetical protein
MEIWLEFVVKKRSAHRALKRRNILKSYGSVKK